MFTAAFIRRMALLEIVGVVFVLPAYTQAADETQFQLETMTVTASKRSTEASDIPASTTILDDIFLDGHQVYSTEKLAEFVPNLYFKQSNSGNAFIARGISTIDTALVSPMGLYVNDVAYPLSYMQSQLLFDVERVEVLRGPQSTLYGKNSSSGVINVVLPDPDNELHARALIEVGSNNSIFTGLSARGPIISDQLFAGITATIKSSDGYMTNITTGDDAADEQSLALRGTLRWTPSDDLDIALTLDGTDQDKGIGYMRLENGPYATDVNDISCDIDDEAEQDSFGQSLRIKYALAGLNLTSITSHQHFNREQTYDFDRSSVPLGNSSIDLSQDIWSQELRLSNATGSTLEWLAGIYAGTEDIEDDWALNHKLASMANNRYSDAEFDSLAAFGQASYLLTDRLKASAGLRVDYYDASGSQTIVRAAGTSSYSKDLSETEALPMVSLSYAMSNQVDSYITYSTGWLAGGYNYYTATSADSFAYDPEYTSNYEAGLKTFFFANRLRANVSVFYTDIDDKQIMQEVSNGGVTARKYTNAAKAHTTGIELELNALPMPGLEIFGGIGYALTEVDDWSGTDYSGNQVPWAPDLTANIGAGYTWDNGIYLRGNMSWTGETYFDAANTLKEDGYLLVNARIGYQFGDWDISLWGRNLFDEEYVTKKSYNSSNLTLVEDGEPLSVGITLSWRI